MPELTARENEVLALAAEGLGNEEIADRLEISRRTVEAHLRTLFRKTGVSRRSQLARLADGPSGLDQDGRRRLERYGRTLRKLVDRQVSLFEERIEIDITVGGPDGADSIVERRWTRPKPYVVYRMVRPIVSSDNTAGQDPDHLALVCDVHGQDVHADATAVTEWDGLPLAIVLFQPGLSAETEWRLRYRADGLWDPLRKNGTDDLFYYAGATVEHTHRPTVTELVLRLLFPPGWTGVQLHERDGHGLVSELVTEATGRQVASWRDADPTTPVYHWQLTGTRPD
jgi:DNA-binding CsgD family transcriptional regulator